MPEWRVSARAFRPLHNGDIFGDIPSFNLKEIGAQYQNGTHAGVALDLDAFSRASRRRRAFIATALRRLREKLHKALHRADPPPQNGDNYS